MAFGSGVASEIKRHGAPYTVRRAVMAAGVQAWKSNTETKTYYPCVARERGYKPSEIVGTIQEGDVLLTVLAASIAVAPVKGDWVASGTHASDAGAEWRQIVNVYAPKRAGLVVVYKLQVRG